MKKIFLTFLVTLFSLSNATFADYNFSSNEKNKINEVITTINNDIKAQWDIHKKIMINIIQRIQLRDNLTEKQEAILELLIDWILYVQEEESEDENIEFIHLELIHSLNNVDEVGDKTVEKNIETVESDYNNIGEENSVNGSQPVENTEINQEIDPEQGKAGIDNNVAVYFDKEEVFMYWKDLLNEVREWEWLTWYSYDESLNITAKKWSDLAVSRWKISHQVDLWDSYYDYSKKVVWMRENWVTCKNVDRATFSESIAWQEFNCNSDDCTEEVKQSIKRSYDFFVWEKWQEYDLHYKAIVHLYFETMWLWLSIVEKSANRYKIYLTNHYCTTNIQ